MKTLTTHTDPSTADQAEFFGMVSSIETTDTSGCTDLWLQQGHRWAAVVNRLRANGARINVGAPV